MERNRQRGGREGEIEIERERERLGERERHTERRLPNHSSALAKTCRTDFPFPPCHQEFCIEHNNLRRKDSQHFGLCA